MVDFGRFRALSDLGFSVKQGEVINVKVVDIGVPLRLRRYDVDPQVAPKNRKSLVMGAFPPRRLLQELQTHMKQALPAAEQAQRGRSGLGEFAAAIKNVVSHFEPMDMQRPVPEISGRLKRFMEESGIFYEKKLEKVIDKFMHLRGDPALKDASEAYQIKNIAKKDIKANLLVMREFLAGKEGLLKALGVRDHETLRNAVEKLLTETTVRQNDTGLKPLRTETVQVFTYLLPVKELEQEAKIKAYYPRKHRTQSEEGFRISLLLAMEKIGPIRADLFLKDRNLAIDFFVIDPQVKEYLNTHLKDLEYVLDDFFDNLSLKVGLSEQKIENFEFEDLASLSEGLIDLKV